jgi:hypothetical protein
MALLEGRGTRGTRGTNSYLHADAKQADGLLCRCIHFQFRLRLNFQRTTTLQIRLDEDTKPMYLLIENSICSAAYYKMSIYEQMLVKS